MTSERGSPGRLARAASRDEDTDEQAVDPKLDAMRAVWLSMRDEEPPGHGMAELLASARRQAAAMARRPALWRRVLVALRRPPALALATVMVLIGGAAMFARRADQMAMHDATVTSGAAVSRDTSPLPGSPAVSTITREASESSAPLPLSTGSPGLGSAARGPATGAMDPSPPSAASTREPRPEALTLGVGTSSAPRSPRVESAGGSSPPAALSRASGERESVPKTDANAEGRADHGSAIPRGPEAVTRGVPLRGPVRGQPRSADDLELSRPTEGDAAPETSVRRSARAPAPLVEQLGKQCESAARRGDCVAVRRIMGRITRIDRDHHARVAKDAGVARCLADSAK